MAHTLQERYSQLVDAKLRALLVKKDGVIFNNRFEGSPKAGAVKVPVRNTEVTVNDYDKQNGSNATHGDTTYLTVTIDKDKSVNEIIDNYDAEAVPDNLVADRLDSAAYSLALQIEKDATAELEKEATVYSDTTALMKDTIYESVVGVRTTMSKANVPTDRRFLLVTPDVYALLLTSPEFVKASNLGDAVVQTGAVGRIAGFTVYEDSTLTGASTEFIAGHPDWCTRVTEWQVPVHLQDINGSGKYIGASAVQGRRIYAHKVTNKKALYIKKSVMEPEAKTVRAKKKVM